MDKLIDEGKEVSYFIVNGVRFAFADDFQVRFARASEPQECDDDRFIVLWTIDRQRSASVFVSVEDAPQTPVYDWLTFGLKGVVSRSVLPVVIDVFPFQVGNKEGATFFVSHIVESKSITHMHWGLIVGTRLVSAFAMCESLDFHLMVGGWIAVVDSIAQGASEV